METFKQFALPVFSALMIAGLAEAWWLLRRDGSYPWREWWITLGVAAGQRMIGFLLVKLAGAALIFGVLDWAWQYRLWTVPLDTAWGLVLLLLASEFAYYWQHRASHQIHWFWATHCVHHSSQHFTLFNAVRLGWTGPISGNFLFLLPLPWLGFAPSAVLAMLAINLLYQFWLHTELIGVLGWFDRVFNSPANHRVHHASNPDCLDRNFGGMLMVWDHVFNTYQAQDPHQRLVYGLTHDSMGNGNPVRVALQGWARMGRQVRTADGWQQAIRVVLGYPR
jgi:sterol desaturase/sphingolipid hydroxylase (fatty acid hydroxylase superfamily)